MPLKMIRHKKATSVTMLLGFVFAIIITMLVFPPILKGGIKLLFNIDSVAKQSYDELQGTIARVASSHQEDTTHTSVMRIGKKSLIALFSKGSDRITWKHGLTKVYFEKPEPYNQDLAYMCLCDGKLNQDSSFLYAFTTYTSGPLSDVLPDAGSIQLKCKQAKLSCDPLEGVDFPAYMDQEVVKEDPSGVERKKFKLTGGLMFGYNDPKEVFVQKGKGDLIGVCYEPPCFPEE